MLNLSKTVLIAGLSVTSLAMPAQAQQINFPTSVDAGTQAKVSRLISFGDSTSSTWRGVTNTKCSDLNIGSDPAQPALPQSGQLWSASSDPVATDWSFLSGAAVQQSPTQVTVVTRDVTNICINR